MRIAVDLVPVAEILAFRELHRAEMRCQIVHDSLHERGMTAPYLLRLDDEPVGYGTVVGFGDDPKDIVNEFFVTLERRGAAGALFAAFVGESGAETIQAQTNDPLLMLLLFDVAGDIERDRVLFEDGFTSALDVPGLTLRQAEEADVGRPFDGRKLETVGEWLLEDGDEVVAIGGILFHYNPPYGDIYMETAAGHRRQGYGSFMVQELKRICYEMDKVPAARCQADNAASRATLVKAGMLPCGSIVTGVIGA